MTTDTGIVAFLNARLDDEERYADSMAQGLEIQSRGGGGYSSTPGNSVTIMTMWLPDRVRRELAAKRAILAAHDPDPIGKFGSVGEPRCLVCLTDRDGYEEQWEADKWPCLTLRALAAIWSDHADYREWKP